MGMFDEMSRTETAEYSAGQLAKVKMDIFRRVQRSTLLVLILSPVGLLLIAVARLLIVSNYNPTTANAIVSSGGYVNTLLSTVVPLIPAFLPYIALILLLFRRMAAGALALTASAFVSPAAMSGSAAIALAKDDWRSVYKWESVRFILLLLLFAVAVVLLAGNLGLGYSSFLRTLGAIIALALVPYVLHVYAVPHGNRFYAEQLKRPWMPAEKITLASHQTVIGYVLPGNDNWLAVLREDTREVVYYPVREIAGRQVCQMADFSSMEPLISLSHASTGVPLCVPGP